MLGGDQVKVLPIKSLRRHDSGGRWSNRMLYFLLNLHQMPDANLHDNAHDRPEVVRVLEGAQFVQRHADLLLLLVVAEPYVGHEERVEQLLTVRLGLVRVLIHVRD